MGYQMICDKCRKVLNKVEQPVCIYIGTYHIDKQPYRQVGTEIFGRGGYVYVDLCHECLGGVEDFSREFLRINIY